jgi:hypothetical protein
MCFLAALLACSGSEKTPPPPAGGLHHLTVEGGFGGGDFSAGAQVHVWAGVDPQSEVASWSGAGAPTEWNGDVEMPDADLTLTASAVPGVAPLEERTYADRPVLGSFPAAPVGLVLFFHGASYATDELEDNAARTIAFHLVAAGYAVVAVPSSAELAAGTGGWNSALDESNPDLQTVHAVVDGLRADGTIDAALPVFAWGMSSGGIFAHTVGAALPTAGTVAYCAPGTAEANAATTAPTAWFMAANDQTFPTGVADASGFRDALSLRGIATDLYVHPTTPLYDERFERVTGITAAQSAAIADQIRASGSVTADGAWTRAGGAAVALLDLSEFDAEQRTAIGAEVEIMAADHELYDDVAVRMTAFLASL